MGHEMQSRMFDVRGITLRGPRAGRGELAVEDSVNDCSEGIDSEPIRLIGVTCTVIATSVHLPHADI